MYHVGTKRTRQVLARYPPEATLPCENVADYCFPQGVRATPIDTRASQSSLNEVLFQPGACQRGSQSFVFMFSGDDYLRGLRLCVVPQTSTQGRKLFFFSLQLKGRDS